MHLNQLASFLAVSKTLNFTGAARQLGVPQSTISRQINDLETQLGVKLFYRTKRDVKLTDEGRTFLPYAREITEAARKGTYAVKQLHEGMAGRLSIAVVSASLNYLSDILAVFHKKYPEIMVDITDISSGESLMDDTDSPYDFWFIYKDMLLDRENFEYMDTHREALAIVRNAGTHAKAENKLSSENFILLSEEADPILYMLAMNYCRTHRFSPQIVNTFEDVSPVMLSVKAGLGVSFLPLSLTNGVDTAKVDIQPLDEESYSIDCIAAWKTSLLNPAASLFIDIMKETG